MERQDAKPAKNAKVRRFQKEPELDALAHGVIGAAIEVAELLVGELKAVGERPIHTAQVLSYLRTGELRLGLLFNFNVYSLRQGIRRVVWSR